MKGRHQTTKDSTDSTFSAEWSGHAAKLTVMLVCNVRQPLT